MKKIVQSLLQKGLGFRTYLFIFSIFKISTLRWDKKENDFFHFLDLIPEEGTILDIGANIGIMSVHIARKKKKANVLSVEPNPYNVRALHKTISFFGIKNATVLEIAVADHDGKLEMVMPVHSAVKMQGLTHVTAVNLNTTGEKFIVPAIRLDNLEFIQKIKSRISAIKMDVENYEYFVLSGGKEMIRKHKPLIYCELWEGENREKCFLLMKELQYKGQILSQGKLEEFDPAKHSGQNFFFIPNN